MKNYWAVTKLKVYNELIQLCYILIFVQFEGKPRDEVAQPKVKGIGQS